MTTQYAKQQSLPSRSLRLKSSKSTGNTNGNAFGNTNPGIHENFPTKNSRNDYGSKWFNFQYWRDTLPETNIFAPNSWWLEDEFPFGMAYFQGLC